MISFVLLPQASQPSMNFNVSTDLFTLAWAYAVNVTLNLSDILIERSQRV